MKKYREQTELYYVKVESPAGNQFVKVAVCDLHRDLMSGEPQAYIVMGLGIQGRIASFFQIPGDPFTAMPCVACSGKATIDRPASILPS